MDIGLGPQSGQTISRSDLEAKLKKTMRRSTTQWTSALARTISAAGPRPHALIAALGPAILDRDGASLGPTQFAQPLRNGGNPLSGGGRCAGAQESDGWLFARRRGLHGRPAPHCGA